MKKLLIALLTLALLTPLCALGEEAAEPAEPVIDLAGDWYVWDAYHYEFYEDTLFHDDTFERQPEGLDDMPTGLRIHYGLQTAEYVLLNDGATLIYKIEEETGKLGHAGLALQVDGEWRYCVLSRRFFETQTLNADGTAPLDDEEMTETWQVVGDTLILHAVFDESVFGEETEATMLVRIEVLAPDVVRLWYGEGTPDDPSDDTATLIVRQSLLPIDMMALINDH